jgi:hypothetical protein
MRGRIAVLVGMRVLVAGAGPVLMAVFVIMLVIVTVPGAVGMHMLMLVMGIHAIDFHFTRTATARRTHHRSPTPLRVP